MALDPIEWIVIGVIVVVIFLWGPTKIPELARSFGRAKKEFDMAKKEAETSVTSLVTSSPQPATATTQPPPAVQPAQPSSSDDILLQTARRLGISTEGKTKQQISEEIVAKSKNVYGP